MAWRAWMFGQFVLIVWAVDLIPLIRGDGNRNEDSASSIYKELYRSRGMMTALLIIGVITSVAALAMLRFYPIAADHSNRFKTLAGPAPDMGSRFFAARQAYDFIAENLPAAAKIQYDPLIYLDLPSGLFQSRQIVVSDHSIYGIPQESFESLMFSIAEIFDPPGAASWSSIDSLCNKYAIDYIVVGDNDALWMELRALEMARPPIYGNNFYRVFPCGADQISRSP
jgi:hypothetical protein